MPKLASRDAIHRCRDSVAVRRDTSRCRSRRHGPARDRRAVHPVALSDEPSNHDRRRSVPGEDAGSYGSRHRHAGAGDLRAAAFGKRPDVVRLGRAVVASVPPLVVLGPGDLLRRWIAGTGRVPPVPGAPKQGASRRAGRDETRTPPTVTPAHPSLSSFPWGRPMSTGLSLPRGPHAADTRDRLEYACAPAAKPESLAT